MGGPWTQKSRAEGENLDHLPTYATLTKSPIEIGGEASWPPLGTRDFTNLAPKKIGDPYLGLEAEVSPMIPQQMEINCVGIPI